MPFDINPSGRFQCNRHDCGFQTDQDRYNVKHIRRNHGDHNIRSRTYRPGQCLGVTAVENQPIGISFMVIAKKTTDRRRGLFDVIHARLLGATNLALVDAYNRARIVLEANGSYFLEENKLTVQFWPTNRTWDGNSLGAAILCSIVGLATKRLCRSDTALTETLNPVNEEIGEVGEILAKTQAARNAGIFRIVLSENNRNEWDALPANLTANMTAVFVQNIEQLLGAMFYPLNH